MNVRYDFLVLYYCSQTFELLYTSTKIILKAVFQGLEC